MAVKKKPEQSITLKGEGFYYIDTIQNTVRMRDRILRSNASKKVAFICTSEKTAHVYVSKLRYPERITTMHPIIIKE